MLSTLPDSNPSPKSRLARWCLSRAFSVRTNMRPRIKDEKRTDGRTPKERILSVSRARLCSTIPPRQKHGNIPVEFPLVHKKSRPTSRKRKLALSKKQNLGTKPRKSQTPWGCLIPLHPAG